MPLKFQSLTWKNDNKLESYYIIIIEFYYLEVITLSSIDGNGMSSTPNLKGKNIMHLPLGYNNQLLEVCQVQCLQKILIVSHISQENNQLCLSILVNQYPLISLTLFILMFGGLPRSLLLVDLDILLSLLMIIPAIAGFFI